MKGQRPQWPFGPEMIEESETGNEPDGFWVDLMCKYLMTCGIGAHLLVGYLLFK